MRVPANTATQIVPTKVPIEMTHVDQFCKLSISPRRRFRVPLTVYSTGKLLSASVP